jgi:hypothetical protein
MTLLIYPLFEKITVCKFNICVAEIPQFGLYQRRHLYSPLTVML